MTEKIYEQSYLFCLEQGWVHNTPIKDVLSDYFDNKNGTKKMFDEHIEKILNSLDCNEINILFGEAPPYYPNRKYPEKGKRQYFYDPDQGMNTSYFKEPCKYFLNITEWEDEKKKNPKKSKKNYLEELADKGVLIFDIFPFPVFQSTDLRLNVVHKDGQSCFLKYLDFYFLPRLEHLLNNIREKKPDIIINMFLFAPKFASIQFLYWLKEKEFYHHLIKFENSNFYFCDSSKSNKEKDVPFINETIDDFVNEISDKNEKIKTDFYEKLKEHPIFVNNSGNPDFSNFVNGKHAKTK